ncbi:MAG: tetratricopeptide repeat protein [Calothrix sp. MO_167.B12]|nr:tetratricopeptide repeat protein [Calothrix sp. MO_167.B12]
MKLLHEKLQQSNAVAISAIAGMGGVGKTELATQYARQHEADYPGGICWLNARDTNLAAEIIQFYQFYVDNQGEIPQQIGERQLTVSEQAIWCWDNWQPEEGLILVVWDDVTDLGSCQQLLPTNNRFRLLITTRLRNLDPNIVEEIPLDILSPEKSLELLVVLVGKKRVEKERETAAELCKWLGYLPLGLELVGRYLADDPDLSLSEMLASLEQQRLNDEALEYSSESWTTAQRGVKAAFELSWQKLDAMTQGVAELLSLFAPDVIPWGLVTSICQRLDGNKADINKAKKQLYKHYLIQRLEDRESSYKIHPLIRQFLQAKLELTPSADELKQAFAAAMVAVEKRIPENPVMTEIESVKDAIPHLIEVAEHLIAVVIDEDLYWVFEGLSRFYEGQGLYALAEPWRKQCVSVLQTRLKEENPYIATSYNNLAGLYSDQGRYTEAEPLYQKALSLRQQFLGEKHPDVATSYNCLAGLYSEQGRYSEAELLYQKALSLRQRFLGEEHPDIATSYNCLAFLYYSQGRYTEAEPLYQKALSLRQQFLGEEHPDVATSYNNLALLYYSQGRYSEVEPLYQKALMIFEQRLGTEHPNTVTVRNNLEFLRSNMD